MDLAEQLLEENIDQVLALTTGFEVVAWNKACEIATGIGKEAILGKRIFDFFPGMEQNKALHNAMTAALNGFKSFVPHDRNDPLRQYVENHFIPLKNASGVVTGILNVIHNVAHRIKAEDELRTLSENVALLNSELVAKNRQLNSLNSELKTFTNLAATHYSDTLRQLYLYFEFIAATEAGKLSNPGRANLRKAQGAIQKMKLLTEDIVSFTRLTEFGSQIESIDLNVVLSSTLDDLSERVESTKAIITTGELPQIQGYSFLVSLVFYHLLENALKFRKENTPPVISVSSPGSVKGSSIAHEAAHAQLDYHVIIFSDNGIGFEMLEEQKIYEIFTRLHTGKYKGSGVGLAICKKVMDLHSGFITAESEPGAGTTFRCYFPVE